MSDPVRAALDTFHATDPVTRLRAALDESGRIAHSVISRKLIRDEAKRRAAIAALVDSGEARIEVVKTGGRPGVFIVRI